MLGGPAPARFAAHRLLASAVLPGGLARQFSSSARREADFTHVVIGGGVVGLAIARALARRQRPGSASSTLLLERHGAVGTETSSRNSEVIHAGIYYGPGSLKTRLCLRGKALLYDYCGARGVPHRRTGKWIVAQTAAHRAALQGIHDLCTRELGVPVRWVGAEEAARREPAVRAEAGVLESTSTGIVDTHALMLALLGEFEQAGGVLALSSPVVGVVPLTSSGQGRDGARLPGSGGWEVRVRDGRTGEESTVHAETVVNAAGLGAADVHNMIADPDGSRPERRRRLFYAKGNYFTPSGGGAQPKVSTLIYPAPEPGHGGLGTHLTLDMAGRVRFGPDVEWVDSPADLAVSAARLPAAAAEIRRYLPSLDVATLRPDYAGIRPKLARAGAVMSGAGFVDFYIRREEGYAGWVNLLGIESPGLTSCLAIGEMVEGLLYSG